MAKVQVFEGGRVQLQPGTSARVVAPDFGPGMGPAIKAVGAQLGEMAQAQVAIEKAEAENQARQADTLAAPAIAEAEAEFRSLKGVSVTDQALRDYETKLGKIKLDAKADLRGEASRMFADVAADRISGSLGRARAHRVEQVRVGQVETAQSRITVESRLAVDASDDPDAFPRHLQTIDDESRVLAQASGWAEDTRKGWVAEKISTVHRLIADKLRDKSPIDADEWIERHQGSILPEDETAARRALIPDLEEAELDSGMSRVEELMVGGGTDEAPTETRSRVAQNSADPLRGRGRVTTTPEEHLKRGRLALDLAAPPGTPIFPPMGGKVVGKGYDPKGNGHFVRVKHANGHVSTYLHMRSASPFDEGEEVNSNTVIGSVGSTGRSTGPHLDYSVKNAAGVAVNPLKVKWDEADLPVYRAERNDSESLYAAARRVATERNYSRRQYDGLLQRIDGMVAREDRLKARQEDAAVRSALDTIDRLGPNGLTRKDQIPNWASLPAQTRIQLAGQIEQNTRPKPIEANGDRVLSLELASVYEPRAFIATDLRQYRHQMTAAEFGALASKQAEMRTKGTAAPAAVDHGRIWSMISRYGPEVGLEPTSKNKGERAKSHRVFEMVRNDLNRVTENKRQPTDDEVKAAFDRATQEVIVRGGADILGLNDSRARQFEVAPGAKTAVSVPSDVHARIVASYRRQTGRDPSEQDIARTYMSNKGQPGFWP